MNAQFHVVNFYKFVDIEDLESLSSAHAQIAHELGLIGTILLAPEGINAALAGELSSLQRYEAWVRLDERLSDVAFKYSCAHVRPFKGLQIKIKPWIIRFIDDFELNVDEIVAGPRLSAQDWYAKIAGQDDQTVVVDTRNWYEVDYGKFNDAVDLKIHHFSHFPAAFLQRFANEREKNFLFYCTGGVRCEKVVPWAIKNGFKNSWQLDGGILEYFKLMGHAAYEGRCFVFDHRWIVDSSLQEVDDTESHQNLRVQPKPYRAGSL